MGPQCFCSYLFANFESLNRYQKDIIKYISSISTFMSDSHKFVHYHWIRVYINHARAEIARVGIRYSLFQKQEKKSSASTMRKNPV